VIPVSRRIAVHARPVRLRSRIITLLLSARRTVARFVAKAEEARAHEIIFLRFSTGLAASHFPSHFRASHSVNFRRAPDSKDYQLSSVSPSARTAAFATSSRDSFEDFPSRLATVSSSGNKSDPSRFYFILTHRLSLCP